MTLAELLNLPLSENNKLAMVIVVIFTNINFIILPYSFIFHLEEIQVER